MSYNRGAASKYDKLPAPEPGPEDQQVPALRVPSPDRPQARTGTTVESVKRRERHNRQTVSGVRRPAWLDSKRRDDDVHRNRLESRQARHRLYE